MTAQPKTATSFADYLLRDQASEQKLEYYYGLVVAQAGSTARHNLIVTNIIGHLFTPTRQRGCRIFSSDMRVQAIDQNVYTYPDISIVCRSPQYLDPSEMTLLNPSVIIEILSPSTEARDRKEKLFYYRSIESLQEYILIAQHIPYIQHYTRQTSHLWLVQLYDTIDSQLTLESLEYTLSMSDLYNGIEF